MKEFYISIGFWIFFILLFLSGNSQNPGIDSRNMERENYRHFIDNDWDSVIYSGKKALKSDIDYFYLRYRMGIAYYNKDNFQEAIHHLVKGLQYNSADPNTLEHLYYSYIYTNRTLESKTLAARFPGWLSTKIKTSKSKIPDYLYFEEGYTLSNNIGKNQRETFNKPPGKQNGKKEDEILFGQQDLNDDKYFFNLGTKLNLSKRISADLFYGLLITSRLRQIQVSDIIIPDSTKRILIPWGDGYYPGYVYDTVFQFYSDSYQLYQNEAYASLHFNAGNGIILTPVFHYLNIQYSTIFTNYNTTDYYLQEIDTIPVKRTIYNVVERDTSFNNFIGALSLSKSIALFNFSINGSWSNLNSSEQYQAGGKIIFYPKGNLNIYTQTLLTSSWQDNVNRIIFEQQIGTKVLKKLWIEGFVTVGEMLNFNEKNAFIVHNTGDKINFRTGADFIIILSDKLELSFRYRFTSEEGELLSYSVQGYKETGFYYQNNTFTGGIKWKL